MQREKIIMWSSLFGVQGCQGLGSWYTLSDGKATNNIGAMMVLINKKDEMSLDRFVKQGVEGDWNSGARCIGYSY